MKIPTKLEGTMTHEEVLAILMKRPGYKEAYEALEPEFAVLDALIEARVKKNMTQRQLAAKLGVHQSSLARFESSRSNPTFAWLSKVARGLGLKIKIVEA